MGMKRLNVLSVFGIRSEAVKMAPLVNLMKADGRFEPAVCVSAQHREMLDMVLRVFGIVPEYDLNVMQPRQTLSGVMTRVLLGLEAVFKEVRPDIVLVHGDPTTSFAASLAAFYQKIPVGHVEAGLRTYNKYEPFPEEINRKLVTAISDLHFAPTHLAKECLLKENVPAENIFVTGNTGMDALSATVSPGYEFQDEKIRGIAPGQKIVLMTAHRTENLGAPLEGVCRAVKVLAERHPEMTLVYAVHLNPAVRETVFPALAGIPNVVLTDPLDLRDMHNLMARCCFVLTDSGGLQEEAPAFHKPVVVLRNVTERPEGLLAGTLKLAGTDEGAILSLCEELLQEGELYQKMAAAKNPFGDGQSSRRVADALLYHFGILPERPMDFS